MHLPEGSARSVLSRLLRRARAPQSDGRKHCSKSSNAFRLVSLAGQRALTRYLLSNRQIDAGAQLQRLMTYLAAACGQSNSGHHSRDNDHALHVHGLLS